MIKKKCRNCSRLFETKNKRKLYCSNACKGNYCRYVLNKDRHRQKCKTCGNIFGKYYEGAKYCSTTCARKIGFSEKNKGVERKCLECGKLFQIKSPNHEYCSNECKYRNYYRDGWEKVEIICKNCGGVAIRNKPSKKARRTFCSPKCRGEFESKEKREERVCAFVSCENTFVSKKSAKKKFCSTSCVSLYNKSFVGKLAFGYNHDVSDNDRTLLCEHCGEKYHASHPSEISTRRFCSRRCARIGIGKVITTPHKKISKFLRKNRIWNRNEHGVGRYSLDIYLGKGRAIEIMGSYWHGDIRIYPKPHNKKQELVDEKDRRKKMFIEKEGITILYLWEKDINENPVVCEELILLFLKNNGSLENYHSMNYFIKSGMPKLRKKILVPRFEK